MTFDLDEVEGSIFNKKLILLCTSCMFANPVTPNQLGGATETIPLHSH